MTTNPTATTRSTMVASDWLLPCPVCHGTMYVYAWRTDGWTDCNDKHREATDPLTYERARREQWDRSMAPPLAARAAS